MKTKIVRRGKSEDDFDWLENIADFYPSLINPYNGPLAVIVLACLIGGGYGLYHHQEMFRSALVFAFGALTVITGLKEPPTEESKKVWLVTFLGQATSTLAYHLSLYLTWIPFAKVIGWVEIDMQPVDENFYLQKDVKCTDKVYLDKTKSYISVAFAADDTDDDPERFANPQSAGEKVLEFYLAGGKEGIKKMATDLFTVWTEVIATNPDYDSEWMETHSREIGAMMLPHLKGEIQRKVRGGLGIDDSIVDDTRGLGIKILKFNPVFSPGPEIIKARNEIQVKRNEREAELVTTETMNKQIAERLLLYRYGRKIGNKWAIRPTPEDEIPPIEVIRNMIFQENLAAKDKVSQTLNEKGLNIAHVS